MNRVWP